MTHFYSNNHSIYILISMLSCHLGLLGNVVLIIKVTKQSDQAEGIAEHYNIHGVRKVTVSIEVDCSVNGHNEELELRGTKKDSYTKVTEPLC